MENSNFKKLSNTLVDYFQRIQNEIDFKGNGLYSKYGRSTKLDLTKDSKLQDLFDTLVASGMVSPKPENSAWVFEITDRIQLLDCAFLYVRFEEVAPHSDYYRIDAIIDGMKVIGGHADHMKTIGAVMSYAESLQNVIDTRINDVVEIAEGKTNSYVVEKTQGNNKLDSQNDSVVLFSGDFPLTTTGGSQIVHADLKIGDIIYITNTNVPDRWVGLKQNNSVTLYKMETAKVDLANYYTKSEVDALIESKISQYLTSIEADDVEFGS